MEPSAIEAINVPNCPKQVHQPQHNHGRMDHGLTCRINHGKVIDNIMGGDTRKTWENHSTTIGGGHFSKKG